MQVSKHVSSCLSVALALSSIVSVSGIRKLTGSDNWGRGADTSPAAEFNEKTEGYCKAVLRRSTCPANEYRGVLVAFHGFTACTDQYDELYPKWNDICWDVFAPVLPGHALGGHIINCHGGGEKCSVSFNGGSQGFDLSELPTGYARQYGRFAKAVTRVAEKELAYRTNKLGTSSQASLATVGLSLGSAVAFRAIIDKPQAWSRALLIHPMLGLGQENSDFQLRNCLNGDPSSKDGHDQCGVVLRNFYIKSMGLQGPVANVVKRQIRGTSGHEVQAKMMKFYSKLSKHAPRLLVGAILDAPVVWGGACAKITQNGREGFCAFQQKHIMAVHVFGMDSLSYNFRGKFPVTQILLTETDGITRNGLSYSAAKHLECAAPGQVSVCIHMFKRGTENANPETQLYWDKNNCLPHASLGSKENQDLPVRWWEPKLTTDIVNFFKGTNNIGNKVPATRDDPNQCVDMPLQDGGEKEPWVRGVVLPQADPDWHTCAK